MTVDVKQLQTWDDHIQAMVDLAEVGDGTLWDRGDVMLHAVPVERDKRGRPTGPPEDQVKHMAELGAAAEMSRTYANHVYLTSAFYDNDVRTSFIEHRIPCVKYHDVVIMCNVAHYSTPNAALIASISA